MSEREKIVENFVENIHCATYEERYLKKIINNTTLINRGRNEAESLNGFWNFCIDQYDSCLRSKWYEEKYFDEEGRQLPIDYSFDQWERIKVPSCWNMLKRLNIDPNSRLKTLSKGTKEKVQLILVMSRDAQLYLLDEPIGGVDPAARDYILDTIISNYNENAAVILSTHLIADIEKVLDDIIFLKEGQIVLNKTVDEVRDESGKSVDALFREVFKC